MAGLILVVEDERHLREPLEHLLRLRQFDVLTADSADHALELLDRYTPDAAIIDLYLRDGSGHDVVGNVPPEAPVIIFSGTSFGSGSGDLAQRRPHTRLIEKPCSLTWLIDTLKDMLSGTREATAH